jgi:hypothetical protein
MKMEPIERSETSASNTQTPRNYPKEIVLHLQHGENSNLKSSYYIFKKRLLLFLLACTTPLSTLKTVLGLVARFL